MPSLRLDSKKGGEGIDCEVALKFYMNVKKAAIWQPFLLH
jgi:hypothetical protein